MPSSATNLIMAFGIVAVGVAIAAAGIYSGKPTMHPAPG
jgi:hypothetical protein